MLHSLYKQDNIHFIGNIIIFKLIQGLLIVYFIFNMNFNYFQSQLKNQPKPTKISADLLPFKVQKPDNSKIVYYQKKGHWTQKQKLKYAFFVTYFKKKFQIKSDRRNYKIFKVMADFVKTRSHNQCRSHHQKMQKQYIDLDAIVSNVAQKYHPRAYRSLQQKYYQQLQNLNQSYFLKQGKKGKEKSNNTPYQEQNQLSISQKQINCLIVSPQNGDFLLQQNFNLIHKKAIDKTRQSYGQIEPQKQQAESSKPYIFEIPAKILDMPCEEQLLQSSIRSQSAFKIRNNQGMDEEYKLDQLQKIQIQKAAILQNYKTHCCLANYYQSQFWQCQMKRLDILESLGKEKIDDTIWK